MFDNDYNLLFLYRMSFLCFSTNNTTDLIGGGEDDESITVYDSLRIRYDFQMTFKVYFQKI